MKLSEMEIGLRYIVTAPSKNREFQIGDRIKLNPDGSIDNINAMGWMPAEDVANATEKAECKLDTKWVSDKLKSANEILKRLEQA